jgi:hypothetical protein
MEWLRKSQWSRRKSRKMLLWKNRRVLRKELRRRSSVTKRKTRNSKKKSLTSKTKARKSLKSKTKARKCPLGSSRRH